MGFTQRLLHTCVGDSGGPALQGDVILGVDSYGASGCGAPSHFRRAATYADFIDQYAGTTAGSGSGSGTTAGSGSGSGSDGGPSDGGGCATTTSQGFGAAFAVIAFAMLRRRRR